MTMFFLRGKGLNLLGMLSHVFLPMITAFCCPSGALVVTCAKYLSSFESFHGKPPFTPMPLAFVAATTIVRRDMAKDR